MTHIASAAIEPPQQPSRRVLDHIAPAGFLLRRQPIGRLVERAWRRRLALVQPAFARRAMQLLQLGRNWLAARVAAFLRPFITENDLVIYEHGETDLEIEGGHFIRFTGREH